MKNGDVLGTGGNIYGPVGRHGLGDKAVRWSRIVSGASAVATGSSHSLAILPDGRLMAWGAGYGPGPGRSYRRRCRRRGGVVFDRRVENRRQLVAVG